MRSHNPIALCFVAAGILFLPVAALALGLAFVWALYALLVYVIGFSLAGLGFIAAVSVWTSVKIGAGLLGAHYLWKLVRA